jgi:hypothetical protein
MRIGLDLPKIISIFIISIFFTVQAYGFDDRSGRNLQTERGDLEASFRQVLGELTKNSSEAGPDIDQPDFAEQIGRVWSIIGEWTSIYLQTHPNASTAELITALKALDLRAKEHIASKYYYSFHFQAVQLAEGRQAAYVLSASWVWTGTFFIVARTGTDNFRVVWDIKNVAEENFPLKNQLGYWAFLSPGYHDGPLTGTVHKLKSGKNGLSRFYVDAITNPSMGQERPAQISIWQWNGTEPECLFMEQYTTTYEGHGISLKGDIMEIRTKETPKTFSSCGSCEDPRGIWRLKITPEKIENLGEQYIEPAIGLIDELFYRIQEGNDTSDITTLEVVSKLNSALERDKEDSHLFIGMVGGWKVKRHNNSDNLLIQFDNTPPLIFTISKKNGKPYIRGVKIKEEKQVEEK